MKKLFAVVCAALLVAAFAVPASADAPEWEFYGSARMYTSWDSADEDAVQTFAGRGFSDSDLAWINQGNSRFGAWARWGDITGRVEMGMGTGNVSTRLIYGIWKFNDRGSFLVGQSYTPIASFMSSALGTGYAATNFVGDVGLLGVNEAYDGRQPQLKLEYQVGNGVFEFAAITNNVNDVGGIVESDTDTTIPKLAARISQKFGPANLRLFGGWNSYEIVQDIGNTEPDYNVDSWLIGGDAAIAFGGFYVNVSGRYAQNPNEFGLSAYEGLATQFNNAVSDVDDVDSWGVGGAVGYTVNDMLKFEGGAGYVTFDRDTAGTGISTEDDTTQWYIQARIKPVKNFTITPEVGQLLLGDLEVTNQPDVDQGDITYFGVQWRIDF
jgi:hypothetical protein